MKGRLLSLGLLGMRARRPELPAVNDGAICWYERYLEKFAAIGIVRVFS